MVKKKIIFNLLSSKNNHYIQLHKLRNVTDIKINKRHMIQVLNMYINIFIKPNKQIKY